jgi:hypothetical protein
MYFFSNNFYNSFYNDISGVQFTGRRVFDLSVEYTGEVWIVFLR